jgi:1-acyl-sn-glycerol-3-phosphate acyltransferase
VCSLHYHQQARRASLHLSRLRLQTVVPAALPPAHMLCQLHRRAAGHIALKRADDSAGFRKFLALGKEVLSHGASIMIFPEGTRSKDGKLAPFKKGAFTIATKARAKVVPISVLGSGDVMSAGREGTLAPGEIRVIVHPAIDVAGKKTAAVSDECRAAIASVLPAWKTA